jgi:amidophosphoribosyltransferase
VVEAIEKVLKETEGAYSLLFLTPTALVAVRDSRGFRPLVLGQLNGAWCVASETCAFDLIDAKYVREVEPGEMVVIDANGIQSKKPFETRPASVCTFEHVYFSRPDSIIFGRSVNESRHKMGKRLAVEHPVDADIVVPVPESGREPAPAAWPMTCSGLNVRSMCSSASPSGRRSIWVGRMVRSDTSEPRQQTPKYST